MAIKWFGDKFFDKATAVNTQAMKDAVLLVERAVKISLSKPGKGKESIRYKPKRKVRVSRPGDPPALDLGFLRSSIDSQVEVKGDLVSGLVGALPRVPYALAMELGSPKQNIRPRPYLRPAVIRSQKKINDIFIKANK